MDTKPNVIKRNKSASISRIIESTAELFAEKGYENTTYTEIAKRANLNISLISRYFGTKENLLFSAVEFMTKDMRDVIGSVPMQHTFDDELLAFADTIINSVLQQSNRVKAVCSTATYNSDFKKKLYSHTIITDFISGRVMNYYPDATPEMQKEIRYLAESVHSLTYAISYFLCIIFGMDEKQVRDLIHYIIRNMMDGLRSNNTIPLFSEK